MKILLVSHDASRTGAPILLLNLVKALKSNVDRYETNFLIKQPSYEILHEFQKLSTTYLAKRKHSNFIVEKLRNRVFKNSQTSFSRVEIEKSLIGVDLVISNTITNGDILPVISSIYKGPILSYIHELNMATSFFSTPSKVEKVLNYSTHFLVPSIAVKDYLCNTFKIGEEKISELSYYIPPRVDVKLKDTTNSARFLIGSAGTTDWRKGADLFIQTAMMFKLNYPEINVKFIWKGAQKSSLEFKRLMYDVEKAGLQEIVCFEEASGNMADFYESLDVFLLVSREDPYPLVVLEAAEVGVPVICFADAGGAVEFVKKSKSISPVRYFDLQTVIDEIYKLYNDRDALEQAGRSSKLYLEKTHKNLSFILDQFECIIRRIKK